MKNGKKFFLNSFAFLMSFLACAIIFGQEKEPDSLARYKKC